jgi:predicted XRE-type DNA-binding protein
MNSNEETAQTATGIWDAVMETPNEEASLTLRQELMEKLAAILKREGWTQAEAAARCCVG